MPRDWKKNPELRNSEFEIYYFESPHKQITEDFRANVVKVTDGDTIRVKTNFRDFDFPIRFLGTNAPEMNEPRGKEVRDWLSNLILNADVDILIDRNNRVGKWGRLLGKVIHGGQEVGQMMIGLGKSTTFISRKEGQLPSIDKELNIEKWL